MNYWVITYCSCNCPISMHTACRDGDPIFAPIFPDSSIAVLKKAQWNRNVKDRITINHNGKLGALEDKGMFPMGRSFLSFFLSLPKIFSRNSFDDLNESLSRWRVSNEADQYFQWKLRTMNKKFTNTTITIVIIIISDYQRSK